VLWQMGERGSGNGEGGVEREGRGEEGRAEGVLRDGIREGEREQW